MFRSNETVKSTNCFLSPKIIRTGVCDTSVHFAAHLDGRIEIGYLAFCIPCAFLLHFDVLHVIIFIVFNAETDISSSLMTVNDFQGNCYFNSNFS
jgi:hypothetical protein